MKIEEVTNCRICDNNDLIEILDLGVQALSGRFPKIDEEDAPKAPLVLVKCNTSDNTGCCGLLQMKHTVSPESLYRHTYGYRSGINATMVSHLSGISNKAEIMTGLKPGDTVLDIGCNDGTLLKSYSIKGINKIGIDPTGEQFRQYYTSDIKLVSDFFNSENYFSETDKKAKVITSISMFYDLDRPIDFVKSIVDSLDPEGIWILEQSYMPEMLKKNSFDTVCHEHLEYYALKQIVWITEHTGLKIIDVEFNEINGGSFRIYVTHKASNHPVKSEKIKNIIDSENILGLDNLSPYDDFKERVFKIKESLTSFLSIEKNKDKSIYIYGASTKGNTLLQFFDIGKDTIAACADRNPEKWGRKTPGTEIPIISEEEARAVNPDYFLVLPWHFKDEFISREKEFLESGGKFIFPLPEFDVIDVNTLRCKNE